jgi:hypothetical protein
MPPKLVSDIARQAAEPDNTPTDDRNNPFPPEAPVATSPPRVVTALRGSWLSRDIKEAIISGAAAHGRDGTGAGGMPGYLEMCAQLYPKEYMGLLGRLVPIQSRSLQEGNASINIGSVNIHPVASDRYLTAQEMRDMARPVVEHIDITDPEAPPAEPELPLAPTSDHTTPPETPETPEPPEASQSEQPE